ncbi:MAG: TMEM165/GDT1 family protein [Firmicutes bacterium]|nr:TMEM165/GDT1 family protein [Bacillota bacterium]
MLQEVIKAFLLIFVAEMGDKTQILAMAFATKYKVSKVLTGVFIGSFLNHGIAILLGAYLSNVIPLEKIQIIAAIMFIAFGLWTLKPDDEKEDTNKANKYGPIVTVALAFFIGELGDKTQLAAMTLATEAKFPIFILIGAVLGMIFTSFLGIIVGSKVGQKIPEFTIKLVSAGIFIFFGLLKLFRKLPKVYLTTVNIIIFLSFLIVIIYVLLKASIKARKDNRINALKEVATTLYIKTHNIKESIEDICLGNEDCGMCKEGNCLIDGVLKMLDDAFEKDKYITNFDFNSLPKRDDKNFNEEKIIKALSLTIAHMIQYGFNQDKDYVINRTREALEILLFGDKVEYKGSTNRYMKELKKKNKKIANKIIINIDRINEKK